MVDQKQQQHTRQASSLSSAERVVGSIPWTVIGFAKRGQPMEEIPVVLLGAKKMCSNNTSVYC